MVTVLSDIREGGGAPPSKRCIPKSFFSLKIDLLNLLQAFMVWFLSDLDRLRGVLSTSKPFYCTSCHFSEKSIFCLKNAFFQLFALTPIGGKNPFFAKKIDFFKAL